MPSPSKRFLINASWVIKLRWVAAIGQLVTIGCVIFLLNIQFDTLWALLAVIATTVISNFVLAVWFARWSRNPQRPKLPWDSILGWVMVLDMLSLTALLFASGGPTNPFCLFFFVNLCLSAAVLSRDWAWALNLLSIGCFALLLYNHHEIPQLNLGSWMHPASESGRFSLQQLGLLIAFTTCSSVIVYFLTRLTGELRQQQLEVAKAQRQNALSEKLEAMGTLAAGAAHELATPLSTIAVVARDVEKAFEEHPPDFPGADEVVEDVHLIRSQLDRCRKILDRMSSRAGDVIGEPYVEVTMQQLADEVLGELLDREQIQVTIEQSVSDKTISVPLDSIGQALRGLLQNALDASAKGSPVRLNISQDDSGWRWQILDSGHGMAKDVLKRIDEPFFTTKQPGKGMGLGVFLAQNVVKRLGGDIQFESQPEQGTTATVHLPFEKAFESERLS